MAVTINTREVFRSTEGVKQYLKALPAKWRGVATQAAADYLLGENPRVLKFYPAYKWVRRKTAYPEVRGWFSEKQRRFVMARIRSGKIEPGYPHRNGDFGRKWKQKREWNNNITIYNDIYYARFLVGPGEQARQPKKVGWKHTGEIIESQSSAIIRAAEKAIQTAIK